MEPLARGIKHGHVEIDTSWKTSEKYQIKTKVYQFIHHAKLDKDFVLPGWVETDVQDQKLIILPDGEDPFLCAWVDPEEFENCTVTAGRSYVWEMCSKFDVSAVVRNAIDQRGSYELQLKERTPQENRDEGIDAVEKKRISADIEGRLSASMDMFLRVELEGHDAMAI